MMEPLRILILEDNPADAELAQFELEEAGFVFIPKVAMTEEDFIRELQEYRPDLILSDYDLPVYNGALALAEARRRCPNTPFILVTGAVSEDRAIEILTQGAKDYVLKSRLQQRLGPAVQRALAEAKEHKERIMAEAELREAHRTLEERVKIRTAALEAEVAARKKIEEALRESERGNRELLETANSIIIRWDINGKIRFINDFGLRFFGFSADELLGHDVMKIVPRVEARTGRNHDILVKDIVVHPELYTSVPIESIRKDGSTVHVVWTNKALQDAEGKVKEILAIGNDVTKLKEAEEAQRLTYERLKTFFDHRIGGIGIVIASAEGGIIQANDYYLNILGCTRDELLTGKVDWRELTPPEWLPADERALAQLHEQGVCDTYEKEYLRRDGSRVPVLITDAMLPGKEKEILAFVLNITKHKLAEGKLRENEERFNRAQEIACLGSWELDLINNRLTWSNEVYRIFGLPPQEFTATYEAFLERVHPGDRQAVDDAYLGSIRENRDTYEIEHRVIRMNTGEIRFVRERCQHVRNASRKIIRSFGMVQDITERKKAEEALKDRTEQLENVNRELESFSYSVSHDLRAPLRAIKGFSQMILKKQGECFDEETRRQFEMITDNAGKMGQLIDDLLAFSRLSSQEVTKRSLDMEELVGEVWQELVIIHPDREMTMKVIPMPAGCGDRALIRQIYANLLGNAVKFTHGRDTAVIESGSYIQDSEKIYYVRDNGVGFDMRFNEKLFGVFQRLHRDEEYKGTGIGLALVKRIVTRHGGRVWAVGEVGKGATFFFTLPDR